MFCAVALVAGAALGFEVALSRVFATLLRYQFAFLVISLALCGIGLGGVYAHKKRDLDLGNTAVFFGVSIALALLLILRGVFAFRPDQFWLAALLVLVPFGASGAFLSAIFSRFSSQGGKLYAFDLAGAALCAVLSVALMQWLGAIQTCLLFAALGALAGVLTSEKRLFPAVVSAILLLLVPYNARFGLWSVPAIPPQFQTDPLTKELSSLADRGVTQPLFTELGDPEHTSKIIDTRWNAFARTDVVFDPETPDSYLLYTNGNVPTNMMRWNGKLWTIPGIAANFPLSDWTFKGADLQGQNVLSIGPGGGLDALLSLRYGAKIFDGAEINPSIIQLMREPKYRAFNGDIYGQPGVRVQTAEGRAFVRDATKNGKRYRLIFSALTKTATAGQGTALLESFIYTSDALNDYLGALDDEGQVAIVGDAPLLLARLFSTATAHFKAQGMNEREAGTHLAAMFYPQPGPYQWALIIKKTPFTASRTAQMSADAKQRQIIPLWLPGRGASDELFSLGSLGAGTLSLDGFIRAGQKQGFNFAPAPDDRPFVLDLGLSPFSIFQSSVSLSILLGLSVLSTFGFAIFLLFRGESAAAGARSTLYFLALGIGFMLVEIPLIQKLILPLGYPTLSLTVILFSLLLGGGAGAAFSQRFEGEKLRAYAQKCALGVAAGALLMGALSGALSDVMLPLSLPLRCILAAILLLPLGFLLGTPFPSGLRLFEGESDKLPLIWALNGTASVAGSIAAAILAKMLGFGAVLSIGALIYLGVAALLGRKSAASIQ
ncbi:hypothetical protein B1R32_11632 [Abditibacterium utsteinense]|uniref:Spermine/spermidine synthase n=1 Tax=Abditibacterium utsteinense TaxID=1960156 RepID=A0A2S8SQJ6_9BACT|nr:hypothetical protein B1R32_11632 [Abditibacterium utsteinense]